MFIKYGMHDSLRKNRSLFKKEREEEENKFFKMYFDQTLEESSTVQPQRGKK